MADLDPGGIAIQDDTAGLAAKDVDQISVFRQLALLAMNGRGQVPLQLLGHRQQLLPILITDHHSGGTENLLRQFGILSQVLVIRDEEEACTFAPPLASAAPPCATTLASASRSFTAAR